MRGSKQSQQLARQFFQLSLVDGHLSADHVAGVLAYLEKHPPKDTIGVLKAYRRLVATEVAKGQALVEHAGPVSESILASIAGAMSQRYNRQVTASARDNPALLAGLRIRIGDDVFESSIASQLGDLAV